MERHGDDWSGSVSESIAVLRGQLAQAREVLDDVDSYYRDFRERELPALGRGRTSAIVIAEVLDHTYTALETLFLRIDSLTRTYEKLQPLIARDLDDFDRFLVRLAGDR